MRKVFGMIATLCACAAWSGLALGEEVGKAPAPVGPAATAPAGKPAPVAAEPAVGPDGAVEFDAKPAQPEETFAAPRVGRAKARVNVRVGPAADKALLGTLNRDDEVRALAQSGKWLRIQVPERTPLWVGAQYVEMPAGATFPATATLKADKVRLRSAGDLKAPILKELPRGTQVEVLGKADTWLKIKAPADVSAWVSGDFIEFGTQVAVVPPIPRPVDSTNPTAPAKTPEPVKTSDPVKTPEPVKEPAVTKQPEPTGTVELKGPGVELFAEAEDAYRQAQAKEPPDYTKAYELYRRTLGVKGVAAPVAAQCEKRLAEIEPKLNEEQRKQVNDRLLAERKEKIRVLREEVLKVQTQLESASHVFTAEGYLTQSPDVAGIPGPYKLTVSGVLLYYLRPSGPAVRLDRLVGKQVGVTGPKRFVPGWGTEVIDVIDAQQLGSAASSKMEMDGPPPAPPSPAPNAGANPAKDPAPAAAAKDNPTLK